MIRPTLSTLTLATALLVVGSGCQTTTSPESAATTEPVAVAAEEPRPAVVFEAVPSEPSSAEESAPSKQDGKFVPASDQELEDYYREDSRANIQAIESRLKPLEIVQSDRPPVN